MRVWRLSVSPRTEACRRWLLQCGTAGRFRQALHGRKGGSQDECKIPFCEFSCRMIPTRVLTLSPKALVLPASL